MEKLSVELLARVRESETEIADLAGRLITIAEERSVVLGAAIVDHKSVQRLEACTQKIMSALASHRERISLLESQIEAAERVEAAARIHAIEGEHQLLALNLAPLHQEWLEGLERLAQLFTESQAGKAKLQLLSDEASYLHERYDTQWAQLPHIALPSRDDVTKALEEGFRKTGWTVHRSTSWKEQGDQLRQKRNAAETRGEHTGPRSPTQRLVRIAPTTFTPGAKAGVSE